MIEFIVNCQKTANLCTYVNNFTTLAVVSIFLCIILIVIEMQKNKWRRSRDFKLNCS